MTGGVWYKGRCFVTAASVALAALALSALSASAQSSTAASTFLDAIFVADTAEIRPEARDRLRRAVTPPPGACPMRTTLSAQVPTMANEAQSLALDRMEALEAFFSAEGLCAENCSIEGVAGDGLDPRAQVAVSYEPLPDDNAPAVGMTWSHQGRVRRGETIRVEATASDSFGRVNSGVRSLAMWRIAEDGALTLDVQQSTFPPPENRDCARPPPDARASFSYAVTAASPRVIRLQVSASDHASNFRTLDPVEFRIEDLTGTWVDGGNGKHTRIVQTGDAVTATYASAWTCDHRNGTGQVSNSTSAFGGRMMSERTIEGLTTICRFGDSSAGLMLTRFELAISEDGRELSGFWIDHEGEERPWSLTWVSE